MSKKAQTALTALLAEGKAHTDPDQALATSPPLLESSAIPTPSLPAPYSAPATVRDAKRLLRESEPTDNKRRRRGNVASLKVGARMPVDKK